MRKIDDVDVTGSTRDDGEDLVHVFFLVVGAGAVPGRVEFEIVIGEYTKHDCCDVALRLGY